ncbi:redox-sensing transcriptional repressor Rex [Arsenicicoccus dermatophilus]|uniref:redox-sensing transcriptional repressor Rex n=1 Tax=Arsenicicoccus dermatophilus TaxID=1076331 RepID=UPI001F4C9865|nr:redox-sensing transcriptional repressor Rex [Arsenicicoccus dermatophilus]MCH8613871.1 redox-sensing transcriptional repressor Rex [Arsenicicoccus dermatophilus]
MVEATERRELSDATVLRLPSYLDALDSLRARGVRGVSSEELATAAGVTSAMLRKDLSQLGSLGVRGVGYETEALRSQLMTALGRDAVRPVVIVGLGRLGLAIASHGGFDGDGFEVVGLLDHDPQVVGTTVLGREVRDVRDLPQVVAVAGPGTIGVVATPGSAAQDVADLLVSAGVRAILTFAPTPLRVPEGIAVREVDLSCELRLLAYRSRAVAAHPTAGGVRA